MMAQITLPGSGTRTTRIGFGCAALTGRLETGRNAALVHRAFDLGIRHFDVAPLYGTGTAEAVLGVALRDRRQQVTIATKVGRPRPYLSMKSSAVRLLLPPEIRRLLRLRKPVSSGGAVASQPIKEDDSVFAELFAVEAVKSSVQESLRFLKTDYLDCLLLHEARPQFITDELLSCLDGLRQSGVVRSLGLATSRADIAAIEAVCPSFFDVHQYSWSPLFGEADSSPVVPGTFTILHRAIAYSVPALTDWLRKDPAALARLSDRCGVDLADPGRLVSVVVASAVAHNPGGIVLVGTRQRDRLVENVLPLADPSLEEAGRRFLEALRLEPDRPVAGSV